MFRTSFFLLFLLFTSCVGMSPSDLKFNSNSARTPASDPTSENDEEISMELQMSDKYYVYSVFDKVFDVTGTSDEDVIRPMITRRSEFGAPCDRYEPSALGVEKSATGAITKTNYEYPQEVCFAGFSASSVASSGAGRYAYSLKACEFLVSKKDRFQAAIKKIYPDGKISSPSEDKVTLAYGLFFTQEKPSQELLDEFMKLNKETTSEKAWKVILLSICSSPEWQTLTL